VKLHADLIDAANVITACSVGAVTVNGVVHGSSLVVPARGQVQAWPVSNVADLEPAHFEQLLLLDPELVLFGSGARTQFIHPSLHRCLIGRGIGMETMDTSAACRTYNILAAEGRRVVAAMVLSGAD